MKKLNQKGLAPLLIVGVIVLIGVVGFTGYYVYDKNTSIEEISTKEESVTYLEIKELGVQISLTDKISDAVYVAVDNNKAALLSTKKAQNDPNCSQLKNQESFSTIIKASAGDSIDDDPSYPNTVSEAVQEYPQTFSKIEDFYYYIQRGNGIGACEQDSEDAAIFINSRILPLPQ